MKVLVLGSGGREHALAWRLSGSESVEAVYVAPGNPGIDRDPRITTVSETVGPELAVRLGVDLAVIGPEQALTEGVADALRAAGVAVVGPSAAAARLEGSKAFAKDFMHRHGIRTAEHRTCATVAQARSAVSEFGVPVVIKADGLAAGKGVSVCESETQAYAAIETIMNERLFGDAGETVVVERFLSGFEASVIVLVDETGHLVLPTAQDHKQIGEGGVGANTGGMGAVAPNPQIDAALLSRIQKEIVEPSVAAIQSTQWLFRGFLFIGLMIDADGPRVLEYNVRFGDPEAQAILPLLEGDLGVLFHGLAQGRLTHAVAESRVQVRRGSSCTVVAASGGYPGPYTTGIGIHLTDPPPASALSGTTEVFFAGVSEQDGALSTAGGRVLSVTGVGTTLEEARRRAYGRMQLVSFDGLRLRSDIGGTPVVSAVIEDTDVLMPQFRKRGGLLPVVVQEAASGEVLMLGYANRPALEKTLATGSATFWSTSRGELWTKGETSGNRLRVTEIRIDCDQDALLYRVQREGGGVCHTTNTAGEARRSCFYRSVSGDGLLVNSEP